MTKRKAITTADGSTTLFDPDSGEHFHSMNGAIEESMHVFIENGLKLVMTQRPKIKILEFGFGTGLNALLTYKSVLTSGMVCDYTSLDAFPLSHFEVSQLNFCHNQELLPFETVFKQMHESEWAHFQSIDPNFRLKKIEIDFRAFKSPPDRFNLIYFDAFSPVVQPELWSVQIFNEVYNCLETNGILVTYSANGLVKRALRESGFTVKRLSGPPGKRHMILAIKQPGQTI